MRVARFSVAGADPRFGIIDENEDGVDEVVVLRGDPIAASIEGGGYETTGERIPLADVKLLAPVIPRSKVVCIGMNYAEHRAELGHVGGEAPLMFLKPNTAIVGPGDAIQIPPVDGRIVHEGELAIVIGKVAKRVKAENWRDVVFGFTIANDVSARDQMFADGQWARAKGYDTFCPIGPWIETDLDPLGGLEIQTYVDDEPRRHGNTSQMLSNVARIIEYASDVWTLLPGDLIITGTPAGLGGFVAGQTVHIDIEGIGRLSNPAVMRD